MKKIKIYNAPPHEIIKELKLREAVIKAAKKWESSRHSSSMFEHETNRGKLISKVVALLAFEKKSGRKL